MNNIAINNVLKTYVQKAEIEVDNCNLDGK